METYIEKFFSESEKHIWCLNEQSMYEWVDGFFGRHDNHQYWEVFSGCNKRRLSVLLRYMSLRRIFKLAKASVKRHGYYHPVLEVEDNENAIKLFLKLNYPNTDLTRR